MKSTNILYLIAALLITANTTFAQSDMVKEAITYEELYDDPYAINKLFLHVQPLYAELFATNVTAGFGIAANYLHKDKADFFASFRHAYARSTDFVRDIAYKNSSIANKPNSFTYMELGGTYHIKDEETDTETKMILYSKRYQKGNRWAAQVPEHTIVPSKVRKVIGARLGGFAYATSIDLKRIAEDQEIILEDEFGTAFPSDLYSHSNQSVRGAFIGGSYSWIKNMAIKPDKGYGILSDDLLLTTFLDVMFAPSITIEDVQYRDPADGNMHTFSTQAIETKKIGFRLGVEGKYNRELSWAYGAEIGARPSVNGKGFFALIKISLPVYSTNLDYGREAFGK